MTGDDSNGLVHSAVGPVDSDALDAADRLSMWWSEGALVTVDQRELPHRCVLMRIGEVADLIAAIKCLAIRGAPAIGLAGAFGVALSAYNHRTRTGYDQDAIRDDVQRIAAARPTAVNLRWALARVGAFIDAGPDAVLSEALAMLAEDRAVNTALAARAADAVREMVDSCTPLRVLTHCNTGRFATSAVGTALGAVLDLAARGEIAEVLVGETRPLLQGARLTAWELAEAGVAHRVLVDSAAASAMANGDVDVVLVGADRITSNGDTANKIGTYALAVLAAHHDIPFMVVAPESTCDEALVTGADIEVEQRNGQEVLELNGVSTSPQGTRAYNPAFDITPAELITAIITERRILRPRGRPVGLVDTGTLASDIAQRLRHYPDFPSAGVSFVDLGGVYCEPVLVKRIADRLVTEFGDTFDTVLAIDARGFVLGSAIAIQGGVPLALARKAGKLPGVCHTVHYGLEYGQSSLQVQCDAFTPAARVLVVDDVLATGGTARAVTTLVTRCGAQVAGVATVVAITALRGVDKLSGYRVVSLCEVTP